MNSPELPLKSKTTFFLEPAAAAAIKANLFLPSIETSCPEFQRLVQLAGLVVARRTQAGDAPRPPETAPEFLLMGKDERRRNWFTGFLGMMARHVGNAL